MTHSFPTLRSSDLSMERAGGGSIINISSNAGIVGLPSGGAYVASKWGLRGLSKTAAIDLGPLGIRVSSVHPGGIHTPMTDFGVGAGDSPWSKKLPLGRMGEADEVANVVTFLASDEASYVTGAEWPVDGGDPSGDPGTCTPHTPRPVGAPARTARS